MWTSAALFFRNYYDISVHPSASGIEPGSSYSNRRIDCRLVA